jgi:hypothetical protein
MGAWGRGGGEGEAKEGEEGGESKKGEGGTRGPVVGMGRRMWSPPEPPGRRREGFSVSAWSCFGLAIVQK